MKNLEKKNPLLFSPLVVFPLGNESLARTQGILHTPISIDSRSKAIPIRIFFSLKTSISSPDSSVGKESACNAGNPSSIPACIRKIPWRRDMLPAPVFLGFPGGSAGKDLPAMQETWVLSLDWEDPLEREWLPTPVFWPGEFHGQRRLVGCSP